ncbi:exonuclease mut-7 homolog [Pectinophora gossypiella]|uniref:exonuclease mut-7 homolog n=1 Tax=Pectinophora gossypiella TaxID=13191 RepID=UPI00214F2A1D|nr:exonuclease mut-7 homolog [Pectinophora gossypiella]
MSRQFEACSIVSNMNKTKMDLNQLVSKNQSIKIVPSVEDSLRATGLNVDLDDNAKLWFQQLKITWKTWKKSATIESHIEMFFHSLPDPHRVALVFTIKSEDFKDCKPKTLPYFIIETLQKWSHVNGVVPDESLKLPAFRIAIQQRNQHFLSLMVKTYQVATIKETILPIVKDMIRDDNCRQASHIVIAMELFEDIPVQDLLFPLILQDKTNMIDEYLAECPNQVQPLLQFLDKLLDKTVSIRDYVQSYIEENKIGHVKYDKLHYKPLGKLVARLCNKFNVPIESCKNLSKNRTTGGLRYLIHQKYQEHNVSSSVWDDLVKDSLKQSAGSAQEFIDMLVDYDKKEALKWAQYLKLPENDLPLALRDLSLQETNDEDEDWDAPLKNATQSCYKLSIPADHIIMIDTPEKFYDLMNSDIVKCNVVSIDCEWKPSFGATQSQVALVQIATLNQVFLIDALILNKQQYSSFWYTFHKSFLENAEIIKIGFGLEQDLKEMKATVTGLGNIKVKGEGLLDLSLLWKNLIDCGLTLSGNSDNVGCSLSSLVQSCFGLPLEKSEQCSNWELRPLRDTQIMYAALDAHVLVEIYYYLQTLSQQQNINFEEICNDVMLEGKKKCTKKKVVDKIQAVDCNKSVKDMKFLVDPTLSNIMCYLRYCGLDTTVMSTTMLWYDVINLAISEDRLILLTKLKCTPTSNFPQKSILDVGKGSIKEQLQKVLSNFNVKIKESDFLSRCINCNSQDMVRLSPNEICNICVNYESSSKNINTRYQRDSDDDDGDFKNFLSDSDCDEDYLQPVQAVYSNNTSCVTNRGVAIEISDVRKLTESQKPGILCQACGKLFWEGDPYLQSVVNVVFSVIKFSN